MTPHDELAELRRRAYGPGGAAGDVDLARLQELEDALRATPPVDPARSDVGHGTTDAGPSPDRDGTAAAPESAVVDAPNRPPQEPMRATLRRRRVIVTLVAIVVVAAIAAAAWFLTRENGTILRRVAVNDTAAQQALAGSLRNYGIDPDSYVQFESFEGFSVWTARIPDRGVRCVLVVDEAAASSTFNGLTAWNCTPEGMAPVADVVQWGDAGVTDLGDRPLGSVARFTFLGDRVRVEVADAREEPLIGTPAPR